MTKVDAARDSLDEAVEIMRRSVDSIECAHLKQELLRRVAAEKARADDVTVLTRCYEGHLTRPAVGDEPIWPCGCVVEGHAPPR